MKRSTATLLFGAKNFEKNKSKLRHMLKKGKSGEINKHKINMKINPNRAIKKHPKTPKGRIKY